MEDEGSFMFFEEYVLFFFSLNFHILVLEVAIKNARLCHPKIASWLLNWEDQGPVTSTP